MVIRILILFIHLSVVLLIDHGFAYWDLKYGKELEDQGS